MNTYQKALEHCPLPDGLEDRLREGSLSEKGRGKGRRFSFRKRRKMAVAGIAAAVFLLTGAAFVIPWDPFFHHRYGIFNLLAENAFQKVNVTAVCGDVTLTLREVIGDASSISYILDYQLPEDTPEEILALVEEKGGAYPLGNTVYCLTGNVTWAEYEASDGGKWAEIDWGNFETSTEYWRGEDNLMDAYRLRGSTSESGSNRYDPETRTITYLIRYNVRSPDVNFTEQPITIVVAPPVVDRDGEHIPLANHPCMITFLPDYQTTERAGTFENGEETVQAKVTSMFFSMSYVGSEYADIEEVADDVTLVYQNGLEVPLGLAAPGAGGTGSCWKDNNGINEIDFSAEFGLLTDTSEIQAVRLGSRLIPLEDRE